jgi:hypothetical protein
LGKKNLLRNPDNKFIVLINVLFVPTAVLLSSIVKLVGAFNVPDVNALCIAFVST